jgi:DNA polymerase-4
MGKGIDSSPVHCYWEQGEVKSMGHSYTLPFDTSDPELIRSYILMLCQKLIARLHEGGRTTRTVALTIRYSDFKMFTRWKTVDYFVDTIKGLYHICLKILQEVGKLANPVRLLGVSATSLAEESKQLYLLERIEKEKNLDRAIKEINGKFGEFTIKPASLLLIGRI